MADTKLTHDEEMQRCFDHIKQCHDAMDRIYFLLTSHCPREKDGNNFVLSPDVYMEMYTTMTQQFPDRPKQALPYDDTVDRPIRC